MKPIENNVTPAFHFEDAEWFRQRGQMYIRIARSLPSISEIYVDLQRKPCHGWQDMDVYLDGMKKGRLTLSEVFDPFPDMKNWLEDVVVSYRTFHQLNIDMEGADYYLCYEGIDFNVGFFYCFDEKKDKMLFYCLCYTTQMVSAMYSAMQQWHKINTADDTKWKRYHLHLEIDNDRKNHDRNNEKYWRYYNQGFKSPLIEYYCFRNKPFHSMTIDDVRVRRRDEEFSCHIIRRVCKNDFKAVPIKERIHMFADYADALFWSDTSCIGDTSVINTKTAGDIYLDIDGLKEWYEEFEKRPICSFNMQPKQWREKGEFYAQKIRELLPDDIEFYYGWLNYELQNKKGYSLVPKIVVNNRLLKEL